MRLSRRFTVVLLVTTSVTLAAPAWAHGQLRPGRAPVGTTVDTVLVVPSERSDHSSSRIALALPPGFTPKSCRAPIGWRCTTADKGFTWERVTGLVEAEDFDLTMQVATTPGTYTLPLAQTYEDGETRTFTGAPGTRDEAPLFTVTGTAGTSPPPRPSRTAAPASTGAGPSAFASPSGSVSASAGATPVPPTTSSTAPTAAASASDPPAGAGLDALPAGRRLESPSSRDRPIALVALGFVALTVLAGVVLMIRRRQPPPPAQE